MQLFSQILLGLNILHRNLIDHRDIKPLNILLFNNNNTAKITDFGISRSISSDYTEMTASLGTILYMAPEAKLGAPVPFKSDIYSLGLLLHFMLTKTLPNY